MVKMILNWKKVLQEIDPMIKYRQQGGWLKTITELDKTTNTGYSLVGDFVKEGDYEMEYGEGLYLDCNKEGTKKKPQTDYRLFRVTHDKVRLLDMVIDADKSWATLLWEAVEEEPGIHIID